MQKELPLCWTWATLAETCEVILGQSPPSSTYNSEGVGLPFFQGKAEFGELFPTTVKWCSKPNKIAEAGDVLVSVRAPVGATNLLQEKACIGRGLAAIRTNEGVPNRYVMYWLRVTRNILEQQGTGTTFKAISGRILRAHPIPLAPIEEQRRIVDEIEKQFTRLDAAVAALERVQANLARYKASVLKAACEGRLVEQDEGDESAEILVARISAERRRRWEEAEWQKHIVKAQKKVAQAQRKAAKRPARLRDIPDAEWQAVPESEYRRYLPKGEKWKRKYVEPEGVDSAEMPDLPSGWVYASMDELLATLTSGSRAWRKYYDRGDSTFIMAQNVRPMYLDLSFRQAVDPPDDDPERIRTVIKKNDLLITIVGANTGDTCRIPSELENHYVCQSVALARPLDSDVSPFLEMFLASPENGQQQFEEYMYGQGRPHLSFDQLRMTVIALPPPTEQQRIVAEVERRLSVVAAVESVVATNLARATRLRQSILQRAFIGQLL